jgi:nucleotide-binding universal stress UspA family protein
MERLLVPIDGSEGARRAAAFAAKQARATGAEVTLVYVYEGASPASLSFVGNAMELLDEGQANVAQASFEAARQSMGGLDVRDHLVEIGHPVDAIVALAARLDASQIIMGSRGLSPMKELLLGSVSDGVVRKAHCPVTIVR